MTAAIEVIDKNLLKKNPTFIDINSATLIAHISELVAKNVMSQSIWVHFFLLGSFFCVVFYYRKGDVKIKPHEPVKDVKHVRYLPMDICKSDLYEAPFLFKVKNDGPFVENFSPPTLPRNMRNSQFQGKPTSSSLTHENPNKRNKFTSFYDYEPKVSMGGK